MGPGKTDGTVSARRSREAGFTLIELMVVLVVIAVLAGMAAGAALYALDVARAGRTVANMRQLSSAVMQYESSTSQLPAGGLQTAASLIAALGNQAGRVDATDAWGHDLYYEPVTVGPTETFRVYSYGKDGVDDGTITGNWVDFNTDLVMEGGVFLQSKW